MRLVHQVYTQGLNRRHGRVDHILQGRYRAIIVDKENYLLVLCRYIVTRRHAESYQTAAWLRRRTANLLLKDTADGFCVSPSRISHIQRMIESRRLT